MSFGLPTGLPSRGQAAEAVAREQQRSVAARVSARPSVFSVKARAAGAGPGGQQGRARGRLLVAEDAIVFAPSGGGTEFAHTQKGITITTVQRRPPWANTFVALHSSHSSLLVTVSARARPKLLKTLRESSFEVREKTSSQPPRPR
jgi:hypothetical protein